MEGGNARTIEQQDDSGDYGSDFTSDEEALLNQLLSELPTEPGADRKLVVKGIEDDERPKGARLPRGLERERRNRPEGASWQTPNTFEAIAIEVELDGGGSTTIGKLFEIASGRAD